MFGHLLIATDGSALSESAGRRSITLAKTLGAKATAMTASIPYGKFTAEYVMVSDTEDAYNRECRSRAEGYLAVIKKAANAAGVACDEVHTFNDHAHEAIIEIAHQRGCDLICMASHGRSGLPALIVGSVTSKVLAQSRIPVLVWR